MSKYIDLFNNLKSWLIIKLIKKNINIILLLLIILVPTYTNAQEISLCNQSYEKDTIQIKEKTILALKTNLLFDAATILNIEVEVPLKDRWSIAGEWIFPWWSFDGSKAQQNNERHTLQVLNLNLEGKYWFGDRSSKAQMTGLFAGVYMGAGLYDLEYKSKGFQGEFFIMGGLGGGYAHTINKSGSLRMEYSIGFGYMQTNYRRYDSHYAEYFKEWHKMQRSTGIQSWIGPSKAKISLVWIINHNKHKGGGI